MRIGHPQPLRRTCASAGEAAATCPTCSLSSRRRPGGSTASAFGSGRSAVSRRRGIEPLIDEGVLYVLTDGDETAAVMALDDHADPEFWTPSDRPESAFYVHKLAVARGRSGQGLGEVMLDWAGLRARGGRAAARAAGLLQGERPPPGLLPRAALPPRPHGRPPAPRLGCAVRASGRSSGRPDRRQGA